MLFFFRARTPSCYGERRESIKSNYFRVPKCPKRNSNYYSSFLPHVRPQLTLNLQNSLLNSQRLHHTSIAIHTAAFPYHSAPRYLHNTRSNNQPSRPDAAEPNIQSNYGTLSLEVLNYLPTHLHTPHASALPQHISCTSRTAYRCYALATHHPYVRYSALPCSNNYLASQNYGSSLLGTTGRSASQGVTAKLKKHQSARFEKKH